MSALEPLVLPPLAEGPHLFLSGPMAVGKSTVGPLVAAALGRPFVDLDRAIEAHAGTSVASLFESVGVAGFRTIEGNVLETITARAQPTVVALGGGTVTMPAARQRVLSRGRVVTLQASPSLLAARAGDSRPLLAGATSPDARAARLARIGEERAAAYAESHATIEVGERTPADVAAEIVALVPRLPVLVALGERSYPVLVGDGTLADVGARVAAAGARGRTLVVTDTNVEGIAAVVSRALSAAGLTPATVVLPPGEAHKTVRSLEAIWDAAIEHGVDRSGALVAVGGGVVGDLTGFAAATLARGVRWAQVPTTLLAMADAAVGGKTAIDRPQGKNLVGAFHQPSLVAVDPEVLSTLPARDRIAGLAEVVKCALLAGEDDLAALERSATELARGERTATLAAVSLALRVKARVVAFDEREAHARLALNLGHTVGHALETASELALLHGEAVGLGLLAAHRLAHRLAGAPSAHIARTAALLRALGLPTESPLQGPELVRWIAADKKRAGGRIRFVVPLAPGEVALAHVTPEQVIEAARP